MEEEDVLRLALHGWMIAVRSIDPRLFDHIADHLLGEPESWLPNLTPDDAGSVTRALRTELSRLEAQYPRDGT